MPRGNASRPTPRPSEPPQGRGARRSARPPEAPSPARDAVVEVKKSRKLGSARAGAHAAPVRVPPIASFNDALEFLYSRPDMERSGPTAAAKDQYKLDRMHAILEVLGNPHQTVRHVHVAGTKGKGSTCEMTAAALEACGYCVGLYTSPHLVDIRERIRLNRKNISESDFARLLKVVADAAAQVYAVHGDATFFELTTALGFLYFAEQAVDLAVIEVGLGGKLDCTNVISPEVAAVALIGYDHTQILGSTLEEIAAQKGGIFKPGAPALTYDQNPAVLKVLRQCAESVGSTLLVVGKDLEFSWRGETTRQGPGVRCTFTSERNNFEHIHVPLKGEHQAQNCGLALAILDQLSARGFACPAPKVTRGIESATLPGRFEVLPTQPRLLLDGAHNPESIAALLKAISQNLPCESLVVIFGCAADKDAGAMLKILATGADKVIFTKAAGTLRAVDPHDLARKFHEASGRTGHVARSLREAVDFAKRAASRDDVIVITGSFYLVGEAKGLMTGKK